MLFCQGYPLMTLVLEKEEIEELIHSLQFVACLHVEKGLANKKVLALIGKLLTEIQTTAGATKEDSQ